MWLRSLLLVAATAISMAANATLTPSRLRCEYLDNPVGIDETAPRLSWILTSSVKNQKQSSYRILVASTKAKVESGEGDLWDSGEVASDETIQIEYRGKALASRQRAWWTVSVKDTQGNEIKAAEPATWEMGLTKADWKAKWVGRPDPVKAKVDAKSAKWIWYPEGDPAKDAPEGDRYFRLKFNLAKKPELARIGVVVDDNFELKVNGREISNGRGWSAFNEASVVDALRTGSNLIEIKAHNGRGPAGLLVALGMDTNGASTTIVSDGDWESSIDGKSWKKAKEIRNFGDAPYGTPLWMHGASPATYLRKSFFIGKDPLRVRAYLSARGLYRVYIDGKRISGDVFTPGWTDYKKRIQYQTYDLSQLDKGPHEILMVLGDGWYAGHVGLAGRENYGPKPMGLCQLEAEFEDGTREVVASDDTWQAGSGPIGLNDLLMGESYDARQEIGGWETPEVQPLGNVPLVGQHSPTVVVLEELKPKSVNEPKPNVHVFDLGQNMVGWARLKVQGRAGDKVTLRFAEMLNPDGTIYTTNLRSAKCTDYYTLKGDGVEVYEPTFTFHGFRYVEVTGYPGAIPTDAITGIVAGSGIPQTGTFECSNPMVNQLQHNIFWGQRGNYLEVPTDCPQRDERLGWMGDAQVFARTATFNNDISSFITKWMQDVEDAQSAPGGFSDVSPRIGDLSDGAPAWGDAGVIVPWTMYLTYGDKRMLERHYAAMKAWVDYIDSANPDHIWVKRSNNNFGDWLNINDDMPRDVLATCYFARSTDLFARIAGILGKADDAAKYGKLLADIKKAFNDKFVASDGTITGDNQTCYVLALWFDLLPADKRAIAEKKLTDHIMVRSKGHLATGFVGVGHLCPTLTMIGATDVAYKLLLNDTFPSWGYSIKHGATTIWERWDGWTHDKGFQDPGMNSFNHYSLGSVGEWMVATVAGIDLDPSNPGFKHIVIHPRPGGGMSFAKASYDSIRGRIESGWRMQGENIEMNIEVPANTTATVYVPTSDAASVTVDAVKQAPARVEGGFAVYELGSGRYSFVAKK